MPRRKKESVGTQLRNRRKELKLTLKDVSKKLDITDMYISEIERDKKIPSDDVIRNLAKIYKMPLADIFRGFERIPEEVCQLLIEDVDLFNTLYIIANDKKLHAKSKAEFAEEVKAIYVKVLGKEIDIDI